MIVFNLVLIYDLILVVVICSCFINVIFIHLL